MGIIRLSVLIKILSVKSVQYLDKSRDTDASVDDPSNGQNRPSPKERPPLPDISLGHKSHEVGILIQFFSHISTYGRI